MKLVFVLYSLFFSSNAMAWRWPWEREDPGPLREIRIWGSYALASERDDRDIIEWLKDFKEAESLEELEEYYRRIGHLEEDETIKDIISHYRKDRFGFRGIKSCHTRLPEKWKNKFTVDPKLRDPNLSTPDLRVRLYDGRGRFLSEDRLRSVRYYELDFTWSVEAYIPYHPEARKIRVVRLEEGKEIVIWERGLYTLEELRSGKVSIVYDNGSDCYL